MKKNLTQKSSFNHPLRFDIPPKKTEKKKNFLAGYTHALPPTKKINSKEQK